MRKILNKIIVVEGKSDVAFLSQYIDAEFVITNGSAIPEETINYLRNATKEIIVLTDPDFPGEQIRDKLNKTIPHLKHCFIQKENSIKNGKVGVAEGKIEEILAALEDNFEISKQNGTITNLDLYNIGLIGKEDSAFKRKCICNDFKLGHCNAKTFLIRLNSKGICLGDLSKYVE